jgi:hypothetical protein
MVYAIGGGVWARASDADFEGVLLAIVSGRNETEIVFVADELGNLVEDFGKIFG